MQALANGTRRRVRVDRQQDEHARLGRVRMVDAGRRADEPVRGLGDHERPALADDPLRLPQHGLHLARVALVAGELDRLRRRLEAVDADHATFRLGHDLLREHEHVAVRELGAFRDHRRQIVALPDLGQAVHGQDRDHAGTPEMRTPA